MIVSGVLKRIGKRQPYPGTVFEVVEIGRNRITDLSVPNRLKAHLRIGAPMTLLVKPILGHHYLLGVRQGPQEYSVNQRPFFIVALAGLSGCGMAISFLLIHGLGLGGLLAGIPAGLIGWLAFSIATDIRKFNP